MLCDRRPFICTLGLISEVRGKVNLSFLKHGVTDRSLLLPNSSMESGFKGGSNGFDGAIMVDLPKVEIGAHVVVLSVVLAAQSSLKVGSMGFVDGGLSEFISLRIYVKLKSARHAFP